MVIKMPESALMTAIFLVNQCKATNAPLCLSINLDDG